MFLPGLDRLVHHWWMQAGIAQLRHFWSDSRLLSFTKLQGKYHLPSDEIFWTHQIRHFIDSLPHGSASAIYTTFENICRLNPFGRGTISHLYYQLNLPPSEIKLRFKDLWEAYTGFSISIQWWFHCCDTLSKGSYQVFLTETFRKLLHYVPSQLHQMFPSVSDRCFRGCNAVICCDMKHIWWTCP